MRPQITVARLITLLAQQPPDAVVEVEGCDCIEGCIGISVKGRTVTLRRADGTLDYSEPEVEVLA